MLEDIAILILVHETLRKSVQWTNGLNGKIFPWSETGVIKCSTFFTADQIEHNLFILMHMEMRKKWLPS